MWRTLNKLSNDNGHISVFSGYAAAVVEEKCKILKEKAWSKFNNILLLTLLTPTPQNGQTY